MDITIDQNGFETKIAPARTFCLEEEALELLKRGLGKGANYDNTLVVGKAGAIKTDLRFPDEPVRHKVLDLMGDLYLLGMPVRGHVVAIKSGHRMNMELVKKLKKKEYERWVT
jgi:UDP-3-O-acyl-N-acetylglucosamine deacetylase